MVSALTALNQTAENYAYSKTINSTAYTGNYLSSSTAQPVFVKCQLRASISSSAAQPLT